MLQNMNLDCIQMLQDFDMFSKALHEFVSNRPAQVKLADSPKDPSVHAILLIIDFVFDMLQDCGLSLMNKIYTRIREKKNFDFFILEGWHYCDLTRVPSKQCIMIDVDIKVHNNYDKWVYCLWIITHIHHIQQERYESRAHKCLSKSLSHEDIELYRSSFVFVWQELERLYTTLANTKYSVFTYDT